MISNLKQIKLNANNLQKYLPRPETKYLDRISENISEYKKF